MPWATAVVDGDRRVTHGELDAATAALAGSLRAAGAGPGSVVLWQAPNWWETVVVALATWRVGAVNAPMLVGHDEPELRQAVAELRPDVVVATPVRDGIERMDAVLEAAAHRPALRVALRGRAAGWADLDALLAGDGVRGAAAVAPEAPCALAYTAGTTAEPRGVVLDSRALLAETRQMCSAWGLAWSDPVLMPTPLAHVTGLTAGLTAPLSAGGSVVLVDEHEPERALELVLAERPSISAATPAFLTALCELLERRPGDVALRQFAVGGARVDPGLIDRAEALGIHAFRGYGLTEHCSVTIANGSHPLETRRDTDGPLAPGTEAECVDDRGRPLAPGTAGELRVRGPERMLGYVDPDHNAAAFTLDGGWLDTGDVATVDAHGRVRVIGRRHDVVRRGGEVRSVRPAERALAAHPAVAAAAVVPWPDERLGEVPVAYVAARSSERLDGDELIRFLGDRGVPAALLPVRCQVVDRLPTSPRGRVRKRELVEWARRRESVAPPGA